MSTRRKSSRQQVGARHHPRPRRVGRPLLQQVATLARLLSASEARSHARRFGLDVPEWRIIAVLGDGAPFSVAEAAMRGAIDKPRASRAVQALARRGLVERTHDAFDARRTLLRLTTKGRALYRRVTSFARARERTLLGALAPVEQRELERLLAKLQREAERLLAVRAREPGAEG